MSDKREERGKMAILLVLYEHHPEAAISNDEIMAEINRRGLMQMTDEEFERERRVAVARRKVCWLT